MANQLFESVAVEDGALRAEIPQKGWRRVVSINSVPADRILALAKETQPKTWQDDLNALIPSVMQMTDAPLNGEVTVVCENAEGTEETCQLYHFAVDKEVAKAALTKNFAGIIAIAKAAGFTEEEVNVVFSTSMVQFEKASRASDIDMQQMMGDMVGNMMGGMAQQARGAAANGENCQPQ